MAGRIRTQKKLAQRIHLDYFKTLHGIPRCHPTVAELLADKAVEVLDIAVPPDVQPRIIRQSVAHADHIRGILAQKPLAMSYREAKECVDLCARAGMLRDAIRSSDVTTATTLAAGPARSHEPAKLR